MAENNNAAHLQSQSQSQSLSQSLFCSRQAGVTTGRARLEICINWHSTSLHTHLLQFFWEQCQPKLSPKLSVQLRQSFVDLCIPSESCLDHWTRTCQFSSCSSYAFGIFWVPCLFFFGTGRVKHVLIDRVQYARWFAIILYANVVMVRLESKMGAGLRGHCGHSVLHTGHCHSTLAFVKS